MKSTSLFVVAGLAISAVPFANAQPAKPADPKPVTAVPVDSKPAAPAQPGQPGQPAHAADQPTPPPPPPARTASVMKWSDPEIEKAAKMLAGFWKTTKAVAQNGGDAGATTDVVLSIAPVMIEGIPDALLCEAARADSLYAPYRVSVFQFYKYKGALRLRTYDLHRNADGTNSSTISMLTGMTLLPQWFPTDIKREWFTGTLDLDLKVEGDKITGKTPYAYPTANGGAVEMTSEIAITKDSLVSSDRGFDAAGKVIWGSSEGDKYAFKRVDSPVAVRTLDDGVVVLEYKKGTGDKAIAEGDRVAAHYTGWVCRNGKQFDSSRTRGNPLMFNQGRLIKAWNVGLIGYSKGSIVRVYCPPATAYGDKGRGNIITPNSDLIFEVEIMSVEVAPPAPTPPANPTPGAAGPDGKIPVNPPPVKAVPVDPHGTATPGKEEPKKEEPKKDQPK